MLALVALALSCGWTAPKLIALPSACQVEVRRTDGAGTLTWRRGYDASGRLSWGEWSETYSGTGYEELRYDSAGRLRSVRGLHHESSPDYPGPQMEFKAEATYDDAGRLTKLVTVNPYDRERLPYRKGERHTLRYGWDERGRLVEMRGPSGGRMLISYSVGDHPTSTVEDYKDLAGSPWTRRATLTWDGDRLLRVVQHSCLKGVGPCDDRDDRFTWDEHGHLVGWTPLKGDAWRYQYDAQGRLGRTVRLSAGSERLQAFTYDEASRLVAIIADDGKGGSETRSYHGNCAAATGAASPTDPLSVVGLELCVPTRVAGCLTMDGRQGH
jgi:YD repeat-containing protein